MTDAVITPSTNVDYAILGSEKRLSDEIDLAIAYFEDYIAGIDFRSDRLPSLDVQEEQTEYETRMRNLIRQGALSAMTHHDRSKQQKLS